MSLIQASGSHAFSVALSLVVIVLVSMENMSPKESNGLLSFAHGLQILVVDHDTLSLMCTAAMLEKYSFKVTTTALASVALSMIKEQKYHYDLVMANISMPDEDRSSLLRVLRKNEIPVIFMSSEVNIDVAKKALAEGACFFLQKPVSSEDMKNLWQHAYRKVRNPGKDTHKPNCGKKIHEAGGVLRPPTGGIRIHEVGGVSRLPTGRDLCLDTQDTRDERQIAAENYTQGAFGINRPVDDEEDQEKAKKVKLNTEQDCDEEGMENQDCDGSSKQKKWHPVWTTELHLKFTAAISALGDQEARPRRILKWMNVPDITVRQVASHLQKYRKNVQRIQEVGTTSLPSLGKSSIWNNRNEFPPARQTSLVCRQYEQGTSSSGAQGNPTQLMTPNSFTGFNDYGRQNLYTEHRVMSHNTNHQSESLYDFYLRTQGKFENLDQILETNSFTLGADMNEIERNQPLGLEEIMVKASERTLLSTNYMTPEFGSPYISANTFQVPNASVSMNQAQHYCPAPTAPFNAQNQDHFSAEATRTTEVGMNQAQFYAPAPTTPINSQNQNHFSAEATGTTEVGMNQAQFYVPEPTTPINSQHQYHFSAEATRITEVGMNQAQFYAPALTAPINSQHQNHFSAEATRTTEVGMNQAQFYAPALTAPINSQHQNHFSAEATRTTEVGMNQAQFYAPALTAPINSQHQNHFSAEATRTTEVGMNQAQFYAPAPTTPINSQNQNHFSAEATGTTEVGMNQAQFYVPEPTTPINSQHQYHFSAEATRITEVGMNQAQFYAPALTAPINSQHQNHFSAEATRTTEVGMNQAQFYAPALTAPINSQHQNHFSAEATRTTEVGMNQAQFYAPALTTPINSQNQNYFSADVTGTTEAGMNRPQYYTPAPTAPLYFQNQNHFSAEVTGTTDVLEVVPEQIPSVNATNAETFPANFTGGSQQLDAAAREAHPSSSNNYQPMSEYDDLLKLLEEDPEKFNWFEPFDSAPNAGDANRYREWLTETLLEKSPDSL